MRIDEIRLKNFRKFEDIAVSFHPEFNLLVGENGSGKTAILEALAIVFEGLVNQYKLLLEYNAERDRDKEEHAYWIYLNNIDVDQSRFTCNNRRIISRDGLRYIDQNFPHELLVEISAQDETNATCASCLIVSPEGLGYRWKKENENEQIHLTKKSNSVVYPCFVYYNISRAKKLEELPTQVRLPLSTDGYADCWTGEFSDVLLKEWFLNREITAMQEGAIPELETVRKAIIQAIPGCHNVQFRASYNSLIIEMKDGTILPFHYLSDGYRNMLSVVADMAHRMARLNPHLGDDVLAETPGVVLIDELDLHLHPKWQRIIADKLRKIFPRVQFIATTHSPQIINHVKPECIRILHDGENGFECVTPGESYGQTVDAILSGILGVKTARPDEIDKKLDLLFEKIERMQLEDAKNDLKKLKEEIVSDPMLLKAEHLIRWKETRQP